MMKTCTLLTAIFFCNFCQSQSIVDYRIYQSSVKSQAYRGTCTAFGLLAAMETFPGFPTDLSEQYLYAASKSYSYNHDKDYDEGTFLKNYIDLMQYEGTLREDQEPYNPDSVEIDKSKTNFENMKADIAGTSLLDLLTIHDFSYKLQTEMYIYKDGDESQNVEYIKQMLDEGVKAVVVSYTINSNYWSINSGKQDDKIDPNDFLFVVHQNVNYSYNDALKIFDGKVFGETDDIYYTDTLFEMDGGHAVCIVGYDDEGFLVKNSWDKNWGDEGYFWLNFEYHKIYAREIMIPKLGKVYVDPSINDAGEWKKKDFRLKSLPHKFDSDALNMHTKSISISVVYYGNMQMPRFNEIVYTAYDNNNNLLGTYYGTTHGIFDGRETGYETYILQSEGDQFPDAYKLVAKFTTSGGESFTNIYYSIIPINKEYIAAD